MKKLIYLFAAIGMALTSCQQEEFLTDENTMITKDDPMELNANTIGEFHNLMVQDYYEELETYVNRHGNENIPDADLRTMMEHVIDEYNYGQSQAVKNLGLDIFDDIIGAESQNAAVNGLVTQVNSYTLPRAVKDFMTDFDNGCNNITSVQQCNEYCASKKTAANANFTGANLTYIISTIDVANASYIYWDEHMDDWKNLLGPNDPPVSGPAKASVWNADKKGAAVGTLSGTSLVGSLVCGGVASALVALWNWITG